MSPQVPAVAHNTHINPRTTNRIHPRRGDHHLFLTSDDNAMMKHIEDTHSPDGRDFDVKPLLHTIEDIVHRAPAAIPGHLHVCIISFLILASLINFYIYTDIVTV